MFRTALLAAVTLQGHSAVACPPQAERVFLGAVGTNVTAYLARTVEVCGTFAARGGADSRERVLYDYYDAPWGREYYAIYVFDPAAQLGAEGARACIVCTPARRDGFTPAEARARGLPNVNMADSALRLPDYVFYPVRCEFDGPARG